MVLRVIAGLTRNIKWHMDSQVFAGMTMTSVA
jgi:hypothetical protein